MLETKKRILIPGILKQNGYDPAIFYTRLMAKTPTKLDLLVAYTEGASPLP